MSIKSADIRNIAVIGHSGEGKTSVCEAILFNGKATDRLGKVTDGNTVTDYDEQEIARKMSISLALAYTMWEGVKINLLDVPGFYDFEGEENEALRAAGGALIVTSATGTVSVGAEKAIEKCLKAKKPMVLFINGMDKENADYKGTIAALQEKYAGKIAPIQIPLMDGNKMVGYINALTEKAFRFSEEGLKEIPIPEEMKATLEQMQANLTETAAENDDALLDKFRGRRVEQGGSDPRHPQGNLQREHHSRDGGFRPAKPRHHQSDGRDRKIHAQRRRARRDLGVCRR